MNSDCSENICFSLEKHSLILQLQFEYFSDIIFSEKKNEKKKDSLQEY